MKSEKKSGRQNKQKYFIYTHWHSFSLTFVNQWNNRNDNNESKCFILWFIFLLIVASFGFRSFFGFVYFIYQLIFSFLFLSFFGWKINLPHFSRLRSFTFAEGYFLTYAYRKNSFFIHFVYIKQENIFFSALPTSWFIYSSKLIKKTDHNNKLFFSFFVLFCFLSIFFFYLINLIGVCGIFDNRNIPEHTK